MAQAATSGTQATMASALLLLTHPAELPYLLRLSLIHIFRGKKVLQVDKMDYSKHPEAKYLRSCKASAHVPEWRRLERCV